MISSATSRDDLVTQINAVSAAYLEAFESRISSANRQVAARCSDFFARQVRFDGALDPSTLRSTETPLGFVVTMSGSVTVAGLVDVPVSVSVTDEVDETVEIVLGGELAGPVPPVRIGADDATVLSPLGALSWLAATVGSASMPLAKPES